jgi:hypothetical protein
MSHEEIEELKKLCRRFFHLIDSLEDWWSSEAFGIGDELTPAIHEANKIIIDKELNDLREYIQFHDIVSTITETEE